MLVRCAMLTQYTYLHEYLTEKHDSRQSGLLILGHVPVTVQGRPQDRQQHHLHGVRDLGEADHHAQPDLEAAEPEVVQGLAHRVGVQVGGLPAVRHL